MAGRSLSPRIAGSASDSNPLAEPDLRIASIALARDLTLVTANLRHFDPALRVENWLT